MAQRVEDLRRAVAPYTAAEKDDCAAAIADMLGGFRAMRQAGADAVATIASVLRAVEGIPPWAIIQGCGLVRTGRAGLNVAYAPNDAEVASVCRRFVQPYATRLMLAEALLKAPVDGEGRSPPDKPAEPLDPLASQIGHDPRAASRE